MGFVLKCLNPFCGLSDLRKTAIFFAQFKNVWIISIVCVSKMINFQHTISHGKIIFASQTFEFVTVLCCVKKLSCKSNLHEVRRKHLWLLSALTYYKKKRFVVFLKNKNLAKFIYVTCYYNTGYSFLFKVAKFPHSFLRTNYKI